MTLIMAAGLALMAGFSIPAGAVVASIPALKEFCLKTELDSFMSYFGGGALLAAISLVLIPRGIESVSVLPASAAFALGGVVFWQFNAWTLRSRNTAGLFTGMVLDFFPEAVLVGTAVAHGDKVAFLLAVLIVLQNMPEGFSAYNEMRESGFDKKNLWLLFLVAPLLGPTAAWLGYAWLAHNAQFLSLLLLFCSGGILYLIFQDIAPGAHIDRKAFRLSGRFPVFCSA